MKGRKSVIAAVISVAAVVGGIVATRPPVRIPPQQPMCTEQPRDGGTCLAALSDGGTRRYSTHVLLPAERALGQCAEPFPCPREP